MIHASLPLTSVLKDLSRQPKGKKPARTLMGSRFVNFPDGPDDNDWRRRTSEAIRDGAANTTKLVAWRDFTLRIGGGEIDSHKLLFARQESRLMVNTAGSVFENGGLCLDRVSGIPFIPGSAVKGCARRAAIAALHRFGASAPREESTENLLAWDEKLFEPIIDTIDSRETFLFAVALIFGSDEMSWKDREDFETEERWQEKRSDFAWACGDSWPDVRAAVATRLCNHLRITPNDANSPWKSLPGFAGNITFFPAYPWEKDPGIDLDIITSHHQNYYEEKDSAFASAPDTEEPIPNIFPAITPGATWVFLLDETRRALPAHLTHARNWLAAGLDVFGIGAKANAGYGWFDASEAFDRSFKQTHIDCQLVSRLSENHKGFTDWDKDRKEEAILLLSERREDCLLWKKIDPESFAPIESFAESIEIPLV